MKKNRFPHWRLKLPQTLKPDEKEPLSALAFKIATDPFVGRLVFVRVYSGVLKSGGTIYNPRNGKKTKISRIYQMHANKQTQRDEVTPGDICGVVGFKNIKTGDTLSDVDHPISLESMEFPESVIGIAIEPKTQADMDKLDIALAKLAEEDPTFTVQTDPDSGQTIIRGMGELHLEILLDRLDREFKVKCNKGQPQVTYKEALTGTIEYREIFKKQTGGRGKFADIQFKLEPASSEVSGLEFVDKVKGGNIPKEFVPAVEKGFTQAMQNGPLAGYSIDRMKVTLLDGSFHPIDSDSLSFEIAARNAFRKVAPKAKPVLLEPVMKLEVVTPEEYMGEVIGDLNKRRGQVDGMETKSEARIIKAQVPLAEIFGYVTVLRNLTKGRATSTMEFSTFQEVPTEIAKEIVEKIKGKTQQLI